MGKVINSTAVANRCLGAGLLLGGALVYLLGVVAPAGLCVLAGMFAMGASSGTILDRERKVVTQWTTRLFFLRREREVGLENFTRVLILRGSVPQVHIRSVRPISQASVATVSLIGKRHDFALGVFNSIEEANRVAQEAADFLGLEVDAD